MSDERLKEIEDGLTLHLRERGWAQSMKDPIVRELLDEVYRQRKVIEQAIIAGSLSLGGDQIIRGSRTWQSRIEDVPDLAAHLAQVRASEDQRVNANTTGLSQTGEKS